jgi:toxin YoeB
MAFYLDFTDEATLDIAKHKKAGNKAILNKILKLLEELIKHPFTGIGKPEPLKHHLTGYWSRRINKEHRLVYEVNNQTVIIHSAYGHYF